MAAPRRVVKNNNAATLTPVGRYENTSQSVSTNASSTRSSRGPSTSTTPSKPRSAPHPGTLELLASTARVGSMHSASTTANDNSPADHEESPPHRVASAGVVSRVRIDVVTNRYSDIGEDNDDVPPPSSSSGQSKSHGARKHDSHARLSRESFAPSSIASSAMSHKSILLIEKELGKPLPLDSTGAHVTLTAADLKHLKDTETLLFLEENSEMFVKYFKEVQQSNEAPSETNSSRKKWKPTSAEDIEHHVKALTDEIETFITAVDYEGRQYHLQVDEYGELHVPVDVAGEEGDDVLADMEDFNDEDIEAFNQEFNLQQETDGEAPAEDEPEGVEDSSDNPNGIRNPFDDRVEVESQQSDVLMGSLDSSLDNVAPEDAMRQRFDDHRKLLAMSGETSLQRKLAYVVAHHKGKKPRFMTGTVASKAATGVLPPSPPPLPAQPTKFSVQFCGKNVRKDDKGKEIIPALQAPVVAVKPQRYTFSKEEEDRIRFILENDDWDEKAMDLDAAGEGDGGVSARSGATATSSSSGLTYDSSRATKYAPSSGGYAYDTVAQAKLRSIDEQLKLLQSAREESGVGLVGDGAAILAIEGVRRGASELLPTPATSTQRSTGRSTKGGDDKRTSTSAVAPSTSAAEEELKAAEKRRQLGDAYLTQYREEKKTREVVGKLNDRLNQLSQDMDVLCTPPFSFNTQYEMNKDPSEWEWPATVPRPSDDAIKALLEVAAREQRSAQRIRKLHMLPGSTAHDEEMSKLLVNDFAPSSSPLDENASCYDVEDTTEVAAASFFHENLRDRLRNALRLTEDAETCRYHQDEPQAVVLSETFPVSATYDDSDAPQGMTGRELMSVLGMDEGDDREL